MVSRRSSFPSRRLVALIVGSTVVPLVALFCLGRTLLDNDRDLEDQRDKQRLEQAAQLVVAALQRAVSSSQQDLASGIADWPEGSVVVHFREGYVEASPKGRVAYFPAVQSLRESPPDLFSVGEQIEHQGHDHASALRVFSELEASSDSAIRAGALLRMGRNLAALGRVADALKAYSALSRIQDVAIDGTPASLYGFYARCELLDREQRNSELQVEARLLDHELRSGRWLLTDVTYKLYTLDTARWLGGNPVATEEERFAEAVGLAWERWLSHAPSGPGTLVVGTRTFAVLWQMAGASARALIVSPQFIDEQWMKPAAVVAAGQNVSFKVGDLDATGSLASVKLKSTETALPWDVVATSLISSGSDPGFLFRRRLLIAGFVVLTLMAVTTSYLIYRAMERELAVVRLQSDFVSAVSHEFRTPLTAMRQFTEMLRESPNLSEDRRIVCYDAQMRSADRLLNLVESLLDFGRMEAGARHYQFEQRDCAVLVQRAVEEFRKDPQAEQFAIQFRADTPVQAATDGEALSRAVRNLLENAVRYSPDDRRVEVALNRTNGHVRISVRDHGIGISADDRARIFKKFQRGEQARLRGIKGTGIGLAMVDEIVKAHHGRVELESEPGAGSTFTIVLPAGD